MLSLPASKGDLPAQYPCREDGIPKQRFSNVHVDLVGPLPTSRAGHRYLLTAIDRSTRWFEAIPLGEVTAEAVLDLSSLGG